MALTPLILCCGRSRNGGIARERIWGGKTSLTRVRGKLPARTLALL
jgi:hypothetical protein